MLCTPSSDFNNPLITEKQIINVSKNSSNYFKVGDYVKYNENERIIYGQVKKCILVNQIQCLHIVTKNSMNRNINKECYLKEEFAEKIKDIKDETQFVENFIIQPSSILKIISDIDDEWKINQEVRLIRNYKGKIIWTGEINTIKAAAVKLENPDEKIPVITSIGTLLGIEENGKNTKDVAFFVRSSLKRSGSLRASNSFRKVYQPKIQETDIEIMEEINFKMQKSSLNPVSKSKKQIGDKYEEEKEIEFTSYKHCLESESKKKVSISKPSESETDSNFWSCVFCTFRNPELSEICQTCLKLKPEDYPNDVYISKRNRFTNEMLHNFKELDDIHSQNLETSFENIIYCYLKDKTDHISLKDWYQHHYPQKKSLQIINKIINEIGHSTSLCELNKHYKSFVNQENQMICDQIPTKKIAKQLIKRSGPLDPDYCNTFNSIPNTLKCTDITEENLWTIIMKTNQYSDHDARIIMTEMSLDSEVQVNTLRMLINDEELKSYLNESFYKGNVTLSHIRQIISEPISLSSAIEFLRRTCCLCCNEFPISEMRGFITCQHEFCKSCAFEWLKVSIVEKYPCNWKCPSCEEKSYSQIDKSWSYSQFREMLLHDQFLLNIFDNKLLQDQLSKCPNFHWCTNEQCINGFEAEGVIKVQCPSCKIYMCVKCNRKWQIEHDDKTCEEFELWMLKNDPDLSKLLNNIGIECPNCGMRYALAPGGCLHFDCKACGIKFCGGCSQLFVDKCNKPKCQMTSFHGHHPRNCLYFLRDYDLKTLEYMLKNFEYPRLQGQEKNNCQSIITTIAFKDKNCTEKAHSSTGLCIAHYKEYLVQFINRYDIDPADFVETNDLNLMLFQMVLPKLVKYPEEKSVEFHNRLKKEVKAKCLFYRPKRFH